MTLINAADGSSSGGGGGDPLRTGLQLVHSSEDALTPEQKALVLSVRKLVANRVRALAPHASKELAKELRAHGMLRAVKAARTYDPSMDTPFVSYAFPGIEGAITDRLKKELNHIKRSRAARSASEAGRAYLAGEPSTFRVALDGPAKNGKQLSEFVGRFIGAMVVGATSAPMDPLDLLIAREERGKANTVMGTAKATMSERQRTALEMSVEEDLPEKVVAEALGITTRSVRRTVNEALDILFAAMLREEITGEPELVDE